MGTLFKCDPDPAADASGAMWRDGHGGSANALGSRQNNGAEDESWLSAAGSVMYGLIAGGRQCCSMRDRTETEAARRASEHGRPPEPSPQPKPESSLVENAEFQNRDVAFPPPSSEKLQASRQREPP